jgi:hypothetical protein
MSNAEKPAGQGEKATQAPLPFREGAGGLGPTSTPDWRRWQAAFWARTGRLDPGSVAVIATLDESVAELLYWSARDLDASSDLDDVIQMIALAQLEAERAAPVPPRGVRLRGEAQRRLRRDAWQVRLSRGRLHRVHWDLETLRDLAGPDGGLAKKEELSWDDVVRILGWQDALAVWLWAVEDWSLHDVGALHEVTRQQAWRRVRRGLTRLRKHLTPPTH